MFRVDWLQAAMDELTDLWVQADSTQRQGLSQRLVMPWSNDCKTIRPTRANLGRAVVALPLSLHWPFVSKSRRMDKR